MLIEDFLNRVEEENPHDVWPWDPRFLYCPLDGKYHYFGCACARQNPDLIPGSLQTWYRENWEYARQWQKKPAATKESPASSQKSLTGNGPTPSTDG